MYCDLKDPEHTMNRFLHKDSNGSSASGIQQSRKRMRLQVRVTFLAYVLKQVKYLETSEIYSTTLLECR